MFLRLDLNVQKSTFSQSLSEFENPGRPHIRFLGSGSRITLETMAYELFKTYRLPGVGSRGGGGKKAPEQRYIKNGSVRQASQISYS